MFQLNNGWFGHYSGYQYIFALHHSGTTVYIRNQQGDLKLEFNFKFNDAFYYQEFFSLMGMSFIRITDGVDEKGVEIYKGQIVSIENNSMTDLFFLHYKKDFSKVCVMTMSEDKYLLVLQHKDSILTVGQYYNSNFTKIGTEFEILKGDDWRMKSISYSALSNDRFLYVSRGREIKLIHFFIFQNESLLYNLSLSLDEPQFMMACPNDEIVLVWVSSSIFYGTTFKLDEKSIEIADKSTQILDLRERNVSSYLIERSGEEDFIITWIEQNEGDYFEYPMFYSRFFSNLTSFYQYPVYMTTRSTYTKDTFNFLLLDPERFIFSWIERFPKYFILPKNCHEFNKTCILGCQSYDSTNGTCRKCSDSFVLSDNLPICLFKVPYCDTYDNSGRCDKCQPTHVLVKLGDECMEMIAGCIEYDLNEGICTQCDMNRILLLNKSTCKPKIEYCSMHNLTTGFCQICDVFRCGDFCDGQLSFEAKSMKYVCLPKEEIFEVKVDDTPHFSFFYNSTPSDENEDVFEALKRYIKQKKEDESNYITYELIDENVDFSNHYQIKIKRKYDNWSEVYDKLNNVYIMRLFFDNVGRKNETLTNKNIDLLNEILKSENALLSNHLDRYFVTFEGLVFRLTIDDTAISFGTLELPYQYNLNDFLEKFDKDLTIDQKVEISKGIIIALKYLHRIKKAYKFLAPENILINWKTRCNFDIKLSRISNIKVNAITNYEAPEILNGSKILNETNDYQLYQKADIWSLGLVLHELLFGKLDKMERVSNETTKNENVLTSISLKLNGFNGFLLDDLKNKKGVSEVIVNLINKCLQEKYEERPAIEDVLEIIDQESRKNN